MPILYPVTTDGATVVDSAGTPILATWRYGEVGAPNTVYAADMASHVAEALNASAASAVAKHNAEAWHAVCDTLDAIYPRWSECAATAKDAACIAIRKLAAGPIEPEAVKAESPACIIAGDVASGFKAYGPYQNVDVAIAAQERVFPNEMVQVMEMEAYDDYPACDPATVEDYAWLVLVGDMTGGMIPHGPYARATAQQVRTDAEQNRSVAGLIPLIVPPLS